MSTPLASRTRCALFVLVVGASLIFAATASAANFTSSQITTPADGTFPTYNFDAPNMIHVDGTTAGGDSNADLVCFFGTSRRLLKANVTVAAGVINADVPLAPLGNTAPRPYCVLRAIPAGDVNNYPPGAPSAFAGPHIGPGAVQTYKVGGGGVNDLVVADYFVGSAQTQGYMDYDSLGGCGVDYSFVFDPITLAQSRALFFCAGWLYVRNGCATGSVTALCIEATRSDLQVDGIDTYLAGGARNLYFVGGQSPQLLAGYPLLAFSRFIDPLNGDVHMSETDQTARCAPKPAAYHRAQDDSAWPADCSSFTPGGVKIDRTGLGDHSGRRATFTDVWSSTDGASHQVDVLYDEEFSGDDPGTVPSPSFDYLWDGSGFIGPAPDDKVAGPASDVPSTVLVDGNGATPDSFQYPQGAVTFSMAPKQVHWWRAGTTVAYGDVRLVFTVPANGSVTIAHSYIQGSSKSEISDQVASEQARIGRPHVAITSPADGSTVDNPAITMTGTATDPAGGITGLTVNGDAVTVAADGTWSKAMTLNLGSNTITATGTDTNGNTTTVNANVTYAVPSPSPGPAVVTPPPAAVPDKLAPALGLTIARIKLAALIAKGLAVKASCSEACKFGVTLVLDAKTAKRVGLAAKNVTVGRLTGSLAAKGSKTVRVKLTKKAKRKLAKVSKVTLAVRLTAKDAAGNSASKSKKIVVKRR